jgi:hypothetical protein
MNKPHASSRRELAVADGSLGSIDRQVLAALATAVHGLTLDELRSKLRMHVTPQEALERLKAAHLVRGSVRGAWRLTDAGMAAHIHLLDFPISM